VRERLTRLEQIAVHAAPGHTLERNGAHELLGAAGHDHVYFGSFLRQKARQRHRLVAGDPSGDAEYDAPPPDVAQCYSCRRRGTTW
jgi:hypothetical protein